MNADHRPNHCRCSMAMVLAVLVGALSSSAATLAPDFAETLVLDHIDRPTAMDIAPDGRVFLAEQSGAVRIIKNGAVLPSNFHRVITSGEGEGGLTGLALDPDFASNGRVYLNYSPLGGSSNVVVRVTASAVNPDVADPGSQTVVFNGPIYPSVLIGGALNFSIDKKLLVSVAAIGGSSAQQLTSLHGKLLRLNPDGSIPQDNPFFSTATGENRAIYAYGLRNPFTFAVQPTTGRIFVNDVGEGTWEEVNEIVAGGNYGWPTFEGPSQPPARSPLWSYPHGAGTGAGSSVIGGTFYNPASVQFPASYVGVYFVADYINGWVNVLDLNQSNTVFNFRGGDGLLGPVSIKVAPDGSLFLLGRGGINYEPDIGRLLHITYSGPPAPIDLWRLANFLTSENSGVAANEANPDDDRAINIMEYALGLDPNAFDFEGYPVGAIALHNGSNYLTLTFTRNADATDLLYTVEVSGNLIAWTPVASSSGGAITSGAGFVSETGAGVLKTVVARDTVPVSLANTRFIRLAVKKN